MGRQSVVPAHNYLVVIRGDCRQKFGRAHLLQSGRLSNWHKPNCHQIVGYVDVVMGFYGRVLTDQL